MASSLERRCARSAVAPVGLTPADRAASFAQPMYSILINPNYRTVDLGAVSRWGCRIEWRAREASEVIGPRYEALCEGDRRVLAVGAYFGLSDLSHPFHVQPHAWLRLTEVQAVKGLADMLNEHDQPALVAFLRALSPTTPWPTDLRRLNAMVEVPVGSGRIDLVVAGYSAEQRWGAIVEVKLEHNASSNPLPRYAAYGRRRLKFKSAATTPGPLAGVLVLLGKRSSSRTATRLSQNKGWRFVHWQALLTRFERELGGTHTSADFRRFRRTLWDRIR